jgi:type II secretory pathway pseudopilin PulG
LIELLAALAIIAVIALLASRALGHAMLSAKGAQGIADLRRIGQAFHEYAADNNGQLPQSSHQGPKVAWTTIIRRSLPKTILQSPLDDTNRPCSYAINDFLTPAPYGAEHSDFSRLQKIPAPSQTLLLGVSSREQRNSDHFHFASEGSSPDAFGGDVWVELIDRASLYLFVDGHVARLAWADLQKTLADPRTRFVRPDGNQP